MLKHVLQTPTLAFTSLGTVSAILAFVFKLRMFEIPAFLLLGAAGGGVAIAFWSLVELHRGETWGWRGLFRSLQKPTPKFLLGFFGHLPQFLAAVAIALVWWKRSQPHPVASEHPSRKVADILDAKRRK